MIKRRYGLIDDKGVFKVKTDTYIKNTFLRACLNIKSSKESRDVVNGFINAYSKAFEYSCELDGNIAIGLKNNKFLCVWEMNNKDSTYVEFLI